MAWETAWTGQEMGYVTVDSRSTLKERLQDLGCLPVAESRPKDDISPKGSTDGELLHICQDPSLEGLDDDHQRLGGKRRFTSLDYE